MQVVTNVTYKIAYVGNIFVGALHQTFFKPWYHLKKLLKYPVLATFPGTQ
jgi:hypothetical protein